jgi:uncharacterized damage-inducible protein DinB
MTTIAELIAELDEETDATRRVLARVPEDRLDWRPHPKSLTLGQLATHVATLPGALAELSTLAEFDVRTPIPRPTADGVAGLLAALGSSVESARATLGAMGDDALATPWRMVDGAREVGALPRGAFLRSTLFNHWYHHRGQLTVYLRQLDVPVPAIYGPSADEGIAP